MTHDLIKNIYSLTLIKYSVLSRLVEISENCICDYILTAIEADDDIISVDIGIGVIYINICNNELSYKFVPNKKLEKKVLKTIDNKNSPLVDAIEKKLNQKIINTYKELL